MSSRANFLLLFKKITISKILFNQIHDFQISRQNNKSLLKFNVNLIKSSVYPRKNVQSLLTLMGSRTKFVFVFLKITISTILFKQIRDFQNSRKNNKSLRKFNVH